MPVVFLTEDPLSVVCEGEGGEDGLLNDVFGDRLSGRRLWRCGDNGVYTFSLTTEGRRELTVRGEGDGAVMDIDMLYEVPSVLVVIIDIHNV